MGGRGSFVNVDANDFTFKAGGQTFVSKGMVGEVKVIEKINGDSVKAPEYSHTPNRIYAVVQNGKLKHLSFYDKNHNQVRSIDLLHEHKNIVPHVHLNNKHGINDPFDVPTAREIAIINAIKKKMRLK